MNLAPDAILGHYRLAEKIGEGGMGVVWKARDLRLDRDVAVKFLSEGPSLTPERRSLLEREARAVAALRHPNIVTIYSIEEFEAKITPRTRAIVLCSPNNPTGTVYTAEELGRVVKLAVKHNLFIIGDEVYKEFVYNGRRHISLLEFEEARDRVIVVDSISKRFSCCGARVGAAITRNDQVYAAMLKFAQARLCPPTIEQRAAIAAYKMGMGYFEPVRREYERRRDVLFEGLSAIPGVVVRKPEGAFYMSVRVPVRDTEKFVIWMLTDFRLDGQTVMVAPESGFYGTPGKGKDEIRAAYVLNEDDLRRALVVFRAGLEKYKATVEK